MLRTSDTRSVTLPSAPNGEGYTDGAAATGVAATVVLANMLNQIQEELARIVEVSLNGTLDGANFQQIADGLNLYGNAIFGDGHDGSINIGINHGQTNDEFRTDVTIQPGLDWSTNGYRLFVSDTLTIGTNSNIENNGGDGADSITGATATTAGTLGSGGGGANGGTAPSNNGSSSTPPGPDLLYPDRPGAPGKGGAGATGAGGGGTGATPAVDATSHDPMVYPDCMTGRIKLRAIGAGNEETFQFISGGAGGGGGGGDVQNGAGGGAGGGVVVIAARHVVIDATAGITANGGNGYTTFPVPVDRMAGGGGGGGVVIIICRTITNPGNVTAMGGSGGVDGNAGLVSILKV